MTDSVKNNARRVAHPPTQKNESRDEDKEFIKSTDENTSSEKRFTRVRLTISLSENTMHLFDRLKALTDADTDSEVFRNALRFQYTLLARQMAGDTFFVKTNGESEAVQLFPFVQETSYSKMPIDDPLRPGQERFKNDVKKELNH